MAGHVGLELRNVVAKYPFETSLRFAGIQPNSGHRDYSRFRCGIGDTQLRGRSAADASSLTHPRCYDGGRPIGDARVSQAIGQPFDRLVPAEAEVLGARVADRPATLPLAKLEQRTSAPVVDGDVLGMGMRSGERRDQHLMPGEDVQARALRPLSPCSLRARRPCGTPSLQLSTDHVLGPRQAQAVHLADNGIAGDSDLAGDLAARKAGMKATLQQLDALRTPARTIPGHVDGLAV